VKSVLVFGVLFGCLLTSPTSAAVFGTDIPGDGVIQCDPKGSLAVVCPTTTVGTVSSPALTSGTLKAGGSTLALSMATQPILLTFSGAANPYIGPLGLNPAYNPANTTDSNIPATGQVLTLSIKNTGSITLTGITFYLQNRASVLPNGQADGLSFGIKRIARNPDMFALLTLPSGPGTLNPADTNVSTILDPTRATFGDLVRFTNVNLAPNAVATYSFYVTDWKATIGSYNSDPPLTPSTSFTLQVVPTPETYTISGKVALGTGGLSGVTMALSGGSTNSTSTDASGNFSLSGILAGNYTLTPSKPGYTFSPASTVFNALGANQTANFTATALPTMSLSQTTLNFGINGALVTSPQMVALSFTGAANVAWSASACPSNITFSPSSGSGNSNIQVSGSIGASCTITFTAPSVFNSTVQLHVNVTAVNGAAPYGFFDTPIDGTTGIAGAIPVTGWALDNVEVAKVDLWREPVGSEPTGNLIFIGNTTFVSGARPDVQNLYPAAPFSYRAGWGYAMLTNFLPSSNGTGTGNGTYKLHAIATNKAGLTLDLGTKTITVDNAHAAKPFGTIDTPTQGGTASGTSFVNFAWALTQQPHIVALDGSTISVIIDGQPVGQPTYNQLRSDISTLFPGYRNSLGAVGFFHIDTTKLSNGVHTISWNVFDDVGHGDGIGSRYFTVANTLAAGVAAFEQPSGQVTQRPESRRAVLEPALRDDSGNIVVNMQEMGRIEILVDASDGYMLLNGERQPLPIGSSMKDGVFYWQPGPGFLGEYQLVFERPDSSIVQVKATIHPKQFDQ
jgi:Carboxypeptidase regulatory-like domain